MIGPARTHPPLGAGAIGTFGLRVLRSGLGFAISLVLARLLGPEDFGAYSVALAIGWLLAGVAVVGTQHLLVREIAVCRARADWGRLQGVLRWTNGAVSLAALLLCLVTVAVTASLGDRLDSLIIASLWPALLLVPVAAQIARRQGAMQGLGRLVAGQVPELLLQPLAMLGLIALAYALPAVGLSAPLAVWLRVAAAAAALWLGYRMLRRTLPQAAAAARPESDPSAWARSCAGFLVLSVTPLVAAQAPVAVLGSIRGSGDAGVFAIALAMAEVLQFVTVAVSAALAPRIAAYHALADHGPLQNLLVKGARAVLMIGVAVAALGLAWASPALSLLGEGYAYGASALGILVCGYALAALLGLPGLLLAMTHHESAAALCNGAAMAATLALCLVLIPLYGVDGAAIATVAGHVTRQVLLAFAVRARLPIGFTPWASARSTSEKSST